LYVPPNRPPLRRRALIREPRAVTFQDLPSSLARIATVFNSSPACCWGDQETTADASHSTAFQMTLYDFRAVSSLLALLREPGSQRRKSNCVSADF